MLIRHPVNDPQVWISVLPPPSCKGLYLPQGVIEVSEREDAATGTHLAHIGTEQGDDAQAYCIVSVTPDLFSGEARLG